MADIAVIPVEDSARGRRAFIEAGKIPYAGDPNFIAPLAFEVATRLDPKKNPTLRDGEFQLFLIRKDGETVGRIAAIINTSHLARYQDGAGHFGFLDAIDDEGVWDAALGAVEAWHRDRGLVKISGPFSCSINEECGMLIDGFERPPYVMMAHGRPWYGAHMERLGYAKAADMHALWWENRPDFMPEKRRRFVEKTLSKDNIHIRQLNRKKFDEEIRIIVDIFNDAWSDNFGFIPFTDEQAANMADELRPIISEHNVVICEYEGEPAAFGLVLPNINEAIAEFDGRLFPFNWAKLIWRLKVQGLKSARMPLMGVRRALQKKPVGIGFAYKMIDVVNSANLERGLKESELSWILEKNESMINILTDMGCIIDKTYRIWEKEL